MSGNGDRDSGLGWPDRDLPRAGSFRSGSGSAGLGGSGTGRTAAGEPVLRYESGLGWPAAGQSRRSPAAVSRETAAYGQPPESAQTVNAESAQVPESAQPMGHGGRDNGAAAKYESRDAEESAKPMHTWARAGQAVGWHTEMSRETAAGGPDNADTDPHRNQNADWRWSGRPTDPGGRAFRGPAGPMIAGTYPGVLSTPGESEDKVAVPAAPDTADTPIARATQAALSARSAGDPWPRPRSCRVLTIANQKGGVGKTTTAVNLAASLAMHNSRVLVIDLDPQGNASTALDVEHRSGTPSIYNVLVDSLPLGDVVRRVRGFRQLYCVPATIDLAGAEIELVPLVARESRLVRAVQGFDASNLDYIFIDCPPSLGLLTVNALVSAPEVLIPIQCEYYALEGLEQLLRTVELVKSHLNPGLKISTILLTMFDSRTRLASQVADEVRGHFGDLVLKSVIPRSVRVSEAPSYGQSVMTYDPGSSGALAYLEAAKEMAFRNNTKAAKS
jgi:chromosome partitioning protein